MSHQMELSKARQSRYLKVSIFYMVSIQCLDLNSLKTQVSTVEPHICEITEHATMPDWKDLCKSQQSGYPKVSIFYMVSIQSHDLDSFKAQVLTIKTPKLCTLPLMRLQPDWMDLGKPQQSRFFTWSWSRVLISTASTPKSWQSRAPGLTTLPLVRLQSMQQCQVEWNFPSCDSLDTIKSWFFTWTRSRFFISPVSSIDIPESQS